MDIGKYIGIEYDRYSTVEFNNILDKFKNLNMKDYYMTEYFINILAEQQISTIIKFINMFENVNNFEAEREGNLHKHSLAGNIIYMISCMNDNKICVYKIIDHLFKLNMNSEKLCTSTNGETYGLDYYINIMYNSISNNNYVMYMVNNFSIIQNVRKLINNYDILLFDITNDLPFIELMLLISRSRHKNLPKFIITHKILYYYLLYKNIL